LDWPPPDGGLEHYDGVVRVVDADRKPVAEQLDPARYDDYIGERTENFSYLKSPFYKPFGVENGCYRVGPMARLNVAEHCGTPNADAALEEFRKLGQGAVLSSFHYHQARLIEIVYCIERAMEILRHPDILDPNIRAIAGTNLREGVGVVEAPRGILIHHYKVDDNGLVTWANLIVATGHNNLAINRGITQAAKYFVKGDRLTEGALNRVEAVVRCYDPCLSCSTHAVGQMAMRVELRDRNGNLLDERQRD
jgi:NAD-reducing hydrogenase large subunit